MPNPDAAPNNRIAPTLAPQSGLVTLRVRPSWWVQLLTMIALTVKHRAFRNELIAAVFAPVVFTLGFYLPLRLVMEFKGIDYAQYVVAIIVLQTMAFTMTSTAQTAAVQAKVGFSSRLRTMPINTLLPMAARVTSALVRSVVSLLAAIGFGYVIGFRLNAGPAQSLLFCVFALAVGFVFTVGADALGTASRNPEAVSQALTLPILIFGMLSTGFVPESGFPEWIRPFARNQPISQFSSAMRDMASTGVTWEGLWPALAWLAGIALVCIPLAIWASARPE